MVRHTTRRYLLLLVFQPDGLVDRSRLVLPQLLRGQLGAIVVEPVNVADQGLLVKWNDSLRGLLRLVTLLEYRVLRPADGGEA